MHSWTAFSFITPTLVLDYLHMLPHLIRNVIPRGCFQLRNCAFEFHSSRINCGRPQTVKSFEMQSNKVAKVRINSSESGKNLDQWYWLILPLLSPPLSSLSPTKKRSWLHGNTTQKQLYIQKVSTKAISRLVQRLLYLSQKYIFPYFGHVWHWPWWCWHILFHKLLSIW